ncbi:MAG: RNA-binding protein, partial [Armatimonadetes bacterium]|nr:RNA-binding protein [Armatimonadota bacterium]
MFALNFYPDIYENLLRNHRKTATIRLGDKTDKYRAGQLVWVTVGNRFARRHKLFTAIIDRVEVKPLAELTPRDISRENPEFRT